MSVFRLARFVNPPRNAGGLALKEVIRAVDAGVEQKAAPVNTRKMRDPAELGMLLCCAEMAQLAYATEKTISSIDHRPYRRVHAEFQSAHGSGNPRAGLPQWIFLTGPDPWETRGSIPKEALFLVFRGTEGGLSDPDWNRNLSLGAVATEVPGVKIHSGFYTGSRMDTVLAQGPVRELVRSRADAPFYVIGHSLGGAVATAFVCGGVMRRFFPEHTGPVRMVNFAGPKVFYRKAPSAGDLRACARDLTLWTVVNDDDMVPRMLGNPLSAPHLRDALSNPLRALAQHLGGTAVDYVHPDSMRVVFLAGGDAGEVPPGADQERLFKLGKALSANAVEDHKMDHYLESLNRVYARVGGRLEPGFGGVWRADYNSVVGFEMTGSMISFGGAGGW